MKAVTWQGKRDVRVEEVPDPFVQEPTDAVIRVTTSNICGSDLHLYEPLAPFMGEGQHPRPREHGRGRGGRRRVRRPARSATASPSRSRSPAATAGCASSSCTPSARPRRCATRAWARRCSASPSSTARCPAARRSTCGCRRPSSPTSSCPTGPPDDRFAYLSDILPTAWQGVEYANVPEGGTLVVLGLGPIGDFACRIAPAQGLPRHRRRPGARAAGARAGPRRRGGRPAASTRRTSATPSAT